ncbi:hypothetical protein [Lachnobacterium bovis]|uniref:Uncharacterized protein n=1 Tax=Lachnobacterium bovis DSM 14045 TaxID=1122142 RepID=A0A1H3JJK3_9FIRM|nr:hypothetical protein [Lachnobacterium bovis]SDY39749.1 hypothetical protein SAMN02910414_01479 [Lachnobacterium bovis DSM 14045]
MKEIINHYAAVLIVAVVSLCCIGFLFGVPGNKSISNASKEIIQERIKKTKVSLENRNNQKFAEVMQRQRPRINYKNEKKVFTNVSYALDDLFVSEDQEGRILKIRIISIRKKESQNRNNSQIKSNSQYKIQGNSIVFYRAGEYTFFCESRDLSNKKTMSKITIPVQPSIER